MNSFAGNFFNQVFFWILEMNPTRSACRDSSSNLIGWCNDAISHHYDQTIRWFYPSSTSLPFFFSPWLDLSYGFLVLRLVLSCFERALLVFVGFNRILLITCWAWRFIGRPSFILEILMKMEYSQLAIDTSNRFLLNIFTSSKNDSVKHLERTIEDKIKTHHTPFLHLTFSY